jgi:copper homeostasis protein
MSRPILEVIALDDDDARAAEAGGADRVELAADMASDGLTPRVDTFAAVRDAVAIPVRVMLRAADGFAAGDVDGLCAAAGELRAAGAEEFVLGFLDGGGAVDLGAVRAVVDAIGGAAARWTFHRAVDRAADRRALRLSLEGVPGLDTYLTAGSAEGVGAGLPALRAEAEAGRRGEPGYGARLMAGGGLRLEHVAVLREAGVDAFHVGSAVRGPAGAGWAGAVDAEAVRVWRGCVAGLGVRRGVGGGAG